MINSYEKPYLKIEELERLVVEQASVIEKLKSTILEVKAAIKLPSDSEIALWLGEGSPKDFKDVSTRSVNAALQYFNRDLLSLTTEILDALAIQTDSTQILQEWLDSVLGESVGYQELFDAIAAGTNPYAGSGRSISVKAFTGCIGPLFKKPDILK